MQNILLLKVKIYKKGVDKFNPLLYNKGKLREREVIKMLIAEKQTINIKIELDNNETISLNDVNSIAWSLIQTLDRNETKKLVNTITGDTISKNDLINVIDVIDSLNHREWVLE